jgi:hypothetical protein
MVGLRELVLHAQLWGGWVRLTRTRRCKRHIAQPAPKEANRAELLAGENLVHGRNHRAGPGNGNRDVEFWGLLLAGMWMHSGLPTLGVMFSGWLCRVRAHFVIHQRAAGDYAALFYPLSMNLADRFLDLSSRRNRVGAHIAAQPLPVPHLPHQPPCLHVLCQGSANRVLGLRFTPSLYLSI